MLSKEKGQTSIAETPELSTPPFHERGNGRVKLIATHALPS